MFMMVSFVLSFFPRDVLDEILNLIESVSEDFPSYSFMDSVADYYIPKSKLQLYQNYKTICLIGHPMNVILKVFQNRLDN